MNLGRGLLVNLEGDAALKDLISGGKYEARVDYVNLDVVHSRPLRAFLVRPDGIVAWAADGNANLDVDAVMTTLGLWFAF